MLPRVVDLVGDCDIPVIAAGGIVDARGYVAALALGAQGVCLGTRYEATSSYMFEELIWAMACWHTKLPTNEVYLVARLMKFSHFIFEQIQMMFLLLHEQ